MSTGGVTHYELGNVYNADWSNYLYGTSTRVSISTGGSPTAITQYTVSDATIYSVAVALKINASDVTGSVGAFTVEFNYHGLFGITPEPDQTLYIYAIRNNSNTPAVSALHGPVSMLVPGSPPLGTGVNFETTPDLSSIVNQAIASGSWTGSASLWIIFRSYVAETVGYESREASIPVTVSFTLA